MRSKGGAWCTAAAVALATVAGCGNDFTGQLAPDGAVPDAAHRGDTGPLGGPVLDAAVVCPSVGGLFDHFDDLARWSEFRDPATSACSIASESGQLALASADATVECGIASDGCRDMTDRALMIDAIAPGDDGLPSPFLRLRLGGGGSLEMRVVEGPDLELRRDGEELAAAPFDPEAQRLWRIMHTAVADRVDFQTAPADTTEWTTLGSAEVAAEEMAEVEVQVGVAGAAAPGDAVAFDDLVGIDF